MNAERRSATCEKRFSLGGALCILTGLAIGGVTLLRFLGYGYEMFTFFRSFFWGFDLEEGFERLFAWFPPIFWINVCVNIIGYAVSGIGALLFVAFGIMLLLKVHSKVLAVFPIASLILMGFTLFKTLYVIVINALDIVTRGTLFYATGLVSIITSFLSLPVALVTAAAWVLLTVLIFANCKKDRTSADGGKLTVFGWIIPAAFALSSLMTVGNTVLSFLLQIVGSLFFNTGIYRNLLQTLVSGVGGFAWGIVAMVLYAVTFFFVSRWIIDPFEKAE